MDHTVLRAITPCSACLYLVSAHQIAPPQTEVADIIAAIIIYHERMKG